MKDTLVNNSPPAAPLSFARLGGRFFGWYLLSNAVILCLLASQAFSAPFDVLFFLAFVGPSALAIATIALWCDTSRPGRRGAVLALLLAGIAGVAWFHVVLLAHGLSVV